MTVILNVCIVEAVREITVGGRALSLMALGGDRASKTEKPWPIT